MDIDTLQKQILLEWLNIDFNYVYSKLEFGSRNYEITKDFVYDTIRCLDYETKTKVSPNINYVITIVALLWEYIDKEKYDVKDFIIKILSRIGYPTSAILVDHGFNKDKCQFSSIHSIIDRITITLNQTPNEIVIGKHKFLLSKFQKSIWEAMEQDKIIGISAPTSAGKSFVILLNLLNKLYNHNTFDILYIIPTLSLQYQVTKDFNEYIKKFDLKSCKVTNSYIEHNNNDRYIFILTQEKLISALNNTDNLFQQKLILIIDEIQNIEGIKEYDDDRSKILFDTIQELKNKKNIIQIIISGPRINDIATVGQNLFDINITDKTSYECPVLNLTYSIKQKKQKYYFKQYCSLRKTPLEFEILNSSNFPTHGKKLFDKKYIEYLNSFLNLMQNQCNILFAPTSTTARKIACALDGKANLIPQIDSLIKYYQKSVHPNYSLCSALKHNIAYHHGKLPSHVRSTLEFAISQKWIDNIVCTTTLLQGVNLPTQNIIIRNPHLYQRKTTSSAELSSYEMANLRGRAGRLLKDFIGRTFVLEEGAFEETQEYQTEKLFNNDEKDLPTGYEDRFEKYKNILTETVDTNNPANNTMQGYGDLLVYIRQTILKYGDSAQSKMQKVGISLTKEQVAAIKLKLNTLNIPKEVCLKNRYWDPFILNSIYNTFHGELPHHPEERGCLTKIDKMLKFLRDSPTTQHMYEKYIPQNLRKGQKRKLLCNLCMEWVKERPLSDILMEKKYDSLEQDKEDAIDSIIDILQKTISFQIPVLLKPIFDIKEPNNNFLNFMQVGSYHKIIMIMINLGIPRETSLLLHSLLFEKYNDIDKNDTDIEKDIRNIILAHKKELNYWIQRQLDIIE